ncbi:hypothetical protein PFISCL1PPCAC_3324, partial [Pristionchus fissidentatus]
RSVRKKRFSFPGRMRAMRNPDGTSKISISSRVSLLFEKTSTCATIFFVCAHTIRMCFKSYFCKNANISFKISGGISRRHI